MNTLLAETHYIVLVPFGCLQTSPLRLRLHVMCEDVVKTVTLTLTVKLNQYRLHRRVVVLAVEIAGFELLSKCC